jgi:hypothetical protein
VTKSYISCQSFADTGFLAVGRRTSSRTTFFGFRKPVHTWLKSGGLLAARASECSPGEH